MDLSDVFFRRKFSTCFYKNLRLELGNMEFSKDFINTGLGDKYPLLWKAGDHTEKIDGGRYFFASDGGSAVRLLGALSPYAVYEAQIEELNGECGFAFIHGKDQAVITLRRDANGTSVRCVCGGGTETFGTETGPGKVKFSVQTRREHFDVYLDHGNKPEYIRTFDIPEFAGSASEAFFADCAAGVYCSGNVVLKKASFFMDSGISQADIRPVCYENGDVMTENGKIYLTMSIRLQEECYQGVFSWIPGTAVFELTGALFFYTGDGVWGNEVASCIVYDRGARKWLLWVCAFSRGHITGYSEFDGDPRFGRNVIDITLTEALPENTGDMVFGGKRGDEDPALFYDEKTSRWYLALCRLSAVNGSYRYVFFESDSPFGGFRAVGGGLTYGAETGGSFVKYDGKVYFVCGIRDPAGYRVYEWGRFDECKNLSCDYPDGGFGGWGTVIPVRVCSRNKLYWLTFDRQRGSDYTWSYGNIYCFEGQEKRTEEKEL